MYECMHVYVCIYVCVCVNIVYCDIVEVMSAAGGARRDSGRAGGAWNGGGSHISTNIGQALMPVTLFRYACIYIYNK